MNFLRRHKYIIVTIILLGCFVLFNPALASGVGDAAGSIVGHIVKGFVYILGKVLVVLMYILIWVCSYNGFVTSAAVSNGWVILRDVCNMFFILILLVIAFATVLNIEGYSWKKLLPKMLLMAVLINFSKLICGFIIDFAQVIMLTFVNGFRDIGGGNLSDMLGINELLNINGSGDETISTLSIMGTYLLALAYVIVAIGVIVIILFVLVMRMVMLWILVTLSPLAYLLGALPNTSKYASKWWSQFTENVVSGPILAFFIWLSFASATADVKVIQEVQRPEKSATDETYFEKTSLGAGLSTAGTPDGMLKFIISIAMLIGGVIITKDLGGAAAKAVGSGMKFNKWGGKKIGDVSQKAGRFAAQTSMRAAGNISTFAGNKLSEKTGGKYGESLQKSGAFVKSWGTDIRETRKLEKTKARQKTLEKLGMKGGTMDLGTKALDTKLGRSIKGGMTMGAGALLMSNPLTAGYGAMLMGIGAGHMGGSLSSKWIGKKGKEKIKTRDQDKTLNKSKEFYNKTKKELQDQHGITITPGKSVSEHVQAIRDRDIALKTQTYLRDKEIKKHDSDEASEKNTIQKDFTAEMKKRGIARNSQEYKDHEKDMQADLQAVTASYDLKRQQTMASFKPKIDPLEARMAQQLAPYQDALKAEKGLENANNIIAREEQKGYQAKERDTQLKTVSDKEAVEIKEAKQKFKSSPLALDAEIKSINTKYAQEKAKINGEYNDREKDISNMYKDTPEYKMRGIVNNKMDKIGDWVAEIQPNRLTIDAMKLGSKEFIAARDSVGALRENDNIKAFEGNYWSTPTGINSQQEKFLSLLAENTKESKEALQNMATGLNKLKGSVSDKKSQDWLANIMRGIAHITSKKPETKNSYTTIIEVLDSLHESKKVEDFKPKTK